MTSQIDRVIAMGKPIAVIRKLVETELLKQDKAAWMSEKQEEYDALYYEDIEYIEVVQDDEGNDVEVTKTKTELKLTAPTFTDWLKETKTIIEAVEATYDEDGMVLTEAVPEVVELVREFVAPEVTEDMLDAYLNTNDGYLKYLKSESNKVIESMTITISSGKEFDANELARVNMMSAVISSEFAGLTETSWRLANNETTVVTLNELKEAVMLALVKFGQLKGIV